MTPKAWGIRFWIAAVAVALFGAASIESYRPGGATDRAFALDSLKRTLATLDDEALDSKSHLTAYRVGLSGTDAVLCHVIRSYPIDTDSIERLATVRWESGVLTGGPDAEAVASLINIAAARSPRVPVIQADLGELCYKMGDPDKAAPFMRRAVELSPAITGRVVTTMLDAGVEPETVARMMPRTVEIVVALREGLVRSGHLEEWLLSAEDLLPQHPTELLWSYADACLATNSTDRLLDHVRHLGVLTEEGAEAKRQMAIGRAQLVREAWGPAASAAARVRALSQADSAVLEFAGQMAFAAGDAAEAEASFHDALRALALKGNDQVDRAGLYRQHGQSLERLGRVAEAFDDYRRALELSPEDPWLRQRFAAATPTLGSEGLD